jgi:hypothetical protein
MNNCEKLAIIHTFAARESKTSHSRRAATTPPAVP